MNSKFFNALSKIRYLALLMFLTLLSTNVWGEHTVVKAGDMVSGEKYIITAEYNSTRYYLTPGSFDAGSSTAGTYTTSLTDAAAWTFTKSSTSWTISTKVGNNTVYLANTNANNGVKTQASSQTWTITATTSGASTVTITGASSRKLALYQGSNWRSYSSSSGVQNITLYKYTAALGYSITYHCNGATSGCPSSASGQSALPSPLPTPTRTGCTFADWYTNEGLTSAATAGATLSANADLYAKWTTNVTLNRNGVVDNSHTGVTIGTTLASIQGAGAQGGCSAWTFVGWSKTQRAAQNNSTAMTLVTTIDGPGPYYAVYSHTESGGGSSTASSDNISSTSTSAVTLETGKPITYTCSASNTYSNPARIYSGNSITIEGGTITSITLTGVSSYPVSRMSASTGTLSSSGNNGTWEGSATSVTFTADGGQTRISAISVTYSGGSTTYYSTTASCCESLGQINGPILLTQQNRLVNGT